MLFTFVVFCLLPSHNTGELDLTRERPSNVYMMQEEVGLAVTALLELAVARGELTHTLSLMESLFLDQVKPPVLTPLSGPLRVRQTRHRAID
eukprot:988618-Pyramimonas_sp.AAC.2